MKVTPPIGYNEEGAPIEEVVTTATRLKPGTWGALAGAIGILFAFTALGVLIADPGRPRSRLRVRRR